MRTVGRMLLKIWRRRRFEHDLEAELAFHRDLAREQANPIGLGNSVQIQEEARDLWRFTFVEDLWRDVLYAVRSLHRAPAFAAISILTLALGIGANTAIFTLLHRVVLAPLPVRDPAGLIEIRGTRGGGPPGTAFSYQALQDLRSQTQMCSDIAGFSNITFHTVIKSGAMERVTGQLVTGNYFSMLGVGAVRGRPITLEDDRGGNGNPVAVISQSMWQTRFGGNAGAIGETLLLENVPFTVIGIAPAGFFGVEVGRHIDIWVPLESERKFRTSYASSTAYKWVQMMGRLKPGASIKEASAELRVLYSKSILENDIPELQRLDPPYDPQALQRMRDWSLIVQPAPAGVSRPRDEYSTPLTVLMTIVGVLLLIACTNVANLLFARAVVREKEIALRLSLGAGRARVIRQLLTESAVLIGAGGTLGLFLAYMLSKYLAGFLAGTNALVLDVSPNLATLAFTATVAVGAVIVFGLMPAFRSTRTEFAVTLKGGASGQPAAGGYRWSRGLIVVQVALLLVLIFGAGLFLRTLHNLNSIDLGFVPTNVLLVNVDPFGSGRTAEQLMPLSIQALETIKALPGVKTASLTRYEPISGGSGINLSFNIPRAGSQPVAARNIWVNNVGPDYFATLGIPMIAGREFGPHDGASPSPVIIVNQAFAERYFGKVSPVGKFITTRGVAMEIIGVSGNAKYTDIRQALEPTVYRYLLQQFGMPLQFLVRTERDPGGIAAALRAEIRSTMGKMSLQERTLGDQIDASIVRERLVTSLAAIFGGLALLLAVIGLYGVISNSVAHRTRDIGLRVALGLDPRSVIGMVLHEVFVLVGGGIVLGLPLAVFVSRSISSLFFGLSPDDPLTMIASVSALLMSGLAAGLFPARRASKVQPIEALRMD